MGGGDTSQRSMKRTKAGVLVKDITLADIEACFTLPTEKACVKLGVGLTILKRLCRKHGIQRWPYRSLLKAGKAQRHPPAASPRGGPKPRATPSPAAHTKPFQQTSTASSHTSHGCQLSADDFGSGSMGATDAQQQWAPFAAAPMPAAAVRAAAPSPPPLPMAADMAAAAEEAAASGCPPAFLAAMQPAAAPSPRKRKQPAGGFEAVQPQPECPAGLTKPDSQMNLLLSAIDACERGTPAAALPDTPLEQREPLLPPFSPLACLPPASAVKRRPFSHSQRSAFRPLAPAGPAPVLLPPEAQQQLADAGSATLQQLKSLLALKMALAQRRQAAGSGLAQSGSSAAAAALLEVLSSSAAVTPCTPGSPASPIADEQRLQLAQKLMIVRAALQARIARKRAALSIDAPSAELPTPQLTAAAMQPAQGFAAFQSLPPSVQFKPVDHEAAAAQLRACSGSGPIPISALPPTNLLEGLSAQESLALQSARSLLAQY